ELFATLDGGRGSVGETRRALARFGRPCRIAMAVLARDSRILLVEELVEGERRSAVDQLFACLLIDDACNARPGLVASEPVVPIVESRRRLVTLGAGELARCDRVRSVTDGRYAGREKPEFLSDHLPGQRLAGQRIRHDRSGPFGPVDARDVIPRLGGGVEYQD